MGMASDTSSLYAVHITGTDAAGITNAHGTFDRIELDDTTQDPNFLGFTGSGLKAINEVEVRTPTSMTIRATACGATYTAATPPTIRTVSGYTRTWWSTTDGPVSASSRWASYRLWRGAHREQRGARQLYRCGTWRCEHHDAQNALVRNNVFGAAIIADVAYLPDSEGVAIRATDSGRSDRPDLWNADIVGNVLNGEVIKGCETPENRLLLRGGAASSTHLHHATRDRHPRLGP